MGHAEEFRVACWPGFGLDPQFGESLGREKVLVGNVGGGIGRLLSCRRKRAEEKAEQGYDNEGGLV